jgi:hypothetical protein
MNALSLSPSIPRREIRFNNLSSGGGFREPLQGIPIRVDF